MHILLAQNCKTCTLLDNIRTIIQKGNMETRQMNPIVCTPPPSPPPLSAGGRLNLLPNFQKEGA